MSLQKKYPILGSSANPEKFSRTLKNLGYFIVTLAALKDIDIPQTQIDLYITALLSIYTGGSTIYFGVLRGIAWLKSKGYIK